MYNYELTRISCTSVFRFGFCAGTCLVGAGGILLGALEQSVVGILGGMFLGLLGGLLSGVIGTVYAAVFNLLAPVTGGLVFQAKALTPTEGPNPQTEPSSPETSDTPPQPPGGTMPS